MFKIKNYPVTSDATQARYKNNNYKLAHKIIVQIIVQIPPYPGQNAVQMPHTRVHSGDQMPPPPGTFHGHKNDRRTAETPSVVEQNLYKYNKN